MQTNDHRLVHWISGALRRRIAWIVAIIFVIAGLDLLPSLIGYAYGEYQILIPRKVRGWLPLGLATLLGLTFQFGPRLIPRSSAISLDTLAGHLLGLPLRILLASFSTVWLVCWIPHYLTWPWWADLDHFSMLAHAWESGILPYRDLIDYNFPGPIYLMWGLGKIFGWQSTASVFLLDAMILIGLGYALVAWSRVRFGGSVAGWCGFLYLLGDYLGLNYSMVAQRDWYATVFLVLGLILLESRPGRASVWISAALFGASLSFRPYGVLFAPAFLSACPARDPRRKAHAMGGWLLAASLMVLIAFTPLLVAGVFDDFVRSLRWVQPGGPYSRNTPASFRARLQEGVVNWRYLTTLAGLSFIALKPLWSRGNEPLSAAFQEPLVRSARTWILALLGVALYKPLSPVAHDYLNLPRVLVESVALVPVVAWFLASKRLTNATRLVGMVVVLGSVLTTIPGYCDANRSWEALVSLAKGRWPEESPPGSSGILFDKGDKNVDIYTWEDYIDTIDYLKLSTDPQTRVANVLRKHPFPTINGPTGRLTPFSSVGGMLWLRWVGTGREAEFAQALEDAGENTVVVWAPSERLVEPGLELPTILETIRRSYRPEARFGIIEVWRRKVGE